MNAPLLMAPRSPSRWSNGLRTAIALITLAAALFVVRAAPISAHNDRYDQLRPQHTSGKCMDVTGGSPYNDALIIQFSCHGGANQDVTVTDKGGGWHEIRFRHSNKCLDLPNWNPGDVQLQQFTCNDTTAQRYTVPCTGCVGTIQNQSSGKCVTVESAGTFDGAHIIQSGCNGSANQRWQLTDTYAVGTAPATGNWAQSIPPCPTNPDPSCHHVTSCEPATVGDYYSFITSGFCNGGSYPNMGGDWATDYYAAEGSWVTFQALGVGTAGANVTAEVWAITQTCSAKSRADGGATVFVDVYTNGYYEGWYAYGHLDAVAVSPGQWINVGASLGKTKWWTNAGTCYQVSSPSGVHTHVEMFNFNYSDFSPDGYGCYISYSFYKAMNSSFALGYIGRTIYGGLRSQC